MIRRRTALATFLACALAELPAAAGEAQDRIFAEGVLNDVATGSRLVYAVEGEGGPAPDGRMTLTLAAGEGGREARLHLDAGSRFDPFPAAGGNPVLLAFLEQTVRDMAEATGGSPFYIRNRIREALAAQGAGTPVEVTVAGRSVPATRFTVQPFAPDPNRARMGGFADLELRFVLSDAVPGRFVALEAMAQPREGPPALRQRVTFDRLEEGE